MLRTDPEGKTVMHHVLMNARYQILNYLLLEYPEMANRFASFTFEKNSALHLAVSLG